MKAILIISKHFYPIESGSEKTTRYIADYLANKGWRVHLFVINGNSEKLSSNICFHRMKTNGIYNLFSKKLYLKEFADIFFTFLPIIQIIIENHIQLVYIHYTESIGLSAVIASRMLNVKSIILWPTSCLYHFKKTENPLSYIINKTYSKMASAFIAKGMSQEQFKVYFKISSNKLFYSVNPIEFKDYFVEKLSPQRPEIIKILYLGKFNNYKRPDLLVKSVQLLQNKNIEIHFYGDGADEENLRGLIKKLKLEEKCIIHEPIKDVKNLISKFQIFVFPSPYESAYSQSLLEAIAASRITIVKYTEGIKRFFPKNSIIGIEKITAKNIAHALDYAIINYEESITIAERGSEIVKNKFSFDGFYKQTKNIILKEYL
ncbi:MAG: hypothetical protein COX48_04735 [bacterium (Candidatus Stahlbacteria) CG23_combo_of_CG06-09_8_20_14_all_34_7]|nr:MAG: hypothetical protein COX48_04735 [bacterium (Candidatus Stahlbacteria) CG23_combo_of_CG06-09_8_20_14_all_34_7]